VLFLVPFPFINIPEFVFPDRIFLSETVAPPIILLEVLVSKIPSLFGIEAVPVASVPILFPFIILFLLSEMVIPAMILPEIILFEIVLLYESVYITTPILFAKVVFPL